MNIMELMQKIATSQKDMHTKWVAATELSNTSPSVSN